MPGDSARKLGDGSRVGVVGGGPAGSFFAYFLLEVAERAGLDLAVDVYEPRDFSMPGPTGCNMCGGIVSESLVQTLAAEGINLPPEVVKRGIDSYVLHMDVGSVRIGTPLDEKRIAAVHRGAGPRGIQENRWRSFDGYLQDLAARKGARIVRGRVEDAEWDGDRPHIRSRGEAPETYDLLAVAAGVNTAVLKVFETQGLPYRSPRTTGTYIGELLLGAEGIERYLGSSMHVFLLDIPRLEFAALIPKGNYVTLVLLGHEIDDPLVRAFLAAPEVKRCLPPGWSPPSDFCHCSPKINVRGAVEPFADRLVFIGDSGESRLYKDGIGAAYRTAKAAAVTAVFQGVGADDFRRHFLPVARRLGADNRIGRWIFSATGLVQRLRFARRGILRTVRREQDGAGSAQRLSTVLWDMFTGSAPYREVLLRTLHPAFLARLLWETGAGTLARGQDPGPARE